MVEEYNSIMKNVVWDIVPRPKGKSIVSSRWLYKIKHAIDGNIEEFKAMFVVRGFSQKVGVDCEETFALVARYTSIGVIMCKEAHAMCKAYTIVEFKMKDIGMMHYFLGLEIWQNLGNIFLGQGKYAVKILKRFRMEDYKPIATPMITNLKKMVASNSKLVDPTLYRQLMGSFMYMVNTKPNICFGMNILGVYIVELRQGH
eukprot:PITA_30387